MTSTLWNKVKSYSDQAPEAGFVNTNFGKLVCTPVVVSWNTVDEVRSVSKRPLKDGEELQEGEQLEMNIKVLISELNPALTFDYERSVPIKNSGSQKTDWDVIVRPSLEKVFGKNTWADAIEKQPYVSVDDTPNISGNASKSTGKVYGVPKFTAKFATKADCEKAKDLRYHKKESVVANGEPTQKAIEETKSLIASVGKEKARKMLDKKPFGDYDSDALFALATAGTTAVVTAVATE